MDFKSHLNTIYKFSILFCCLIALYVFSMTIAFAIPNSRIANNTAKSLQVIEREGKYPRPFFNTYTYGCQLDNFTDKIMFKKTMKEEDLSPFKSGINVSGYFRYWHGYLVFLRPSLLFVNYFGIRYLNLFIFFITLGLMFSLLKEKLGTVISIGFMMCMMMGYTFLIPMSMQFMSVFMIMMAASIIILSFYNKGNFIKGLIYFFFIIGSVTNFMDLLTAPLLTLGIPLAIIVLLAINENKENKVINNILEVIKYSISWTAGYGLTWAMKWVLTSIILRADAFSDAANAILFRTEGNTDHPLNRLIMYNRNLKTIFPMIFIKLAIVLFLIWIVTFILYRKDFKKILNIIPLLIISVFPYGWYLILGNHSDIHYWFTYRIQIITVFCIMASMVYCIDKNKIYDKFHN